MKLKQKQLGVSPIGVLLIIVVAGFFVMCAVKLIPVYQDYYLAKGIIENLKNEPDVSLGKRKIESIIESRLGMNAVRSLSLDDFIIDVEGDTTTIELNYESRVPLMFNLDIVAKFDHVVEINQAGK